MIFLTYGFLSIHKIQIASISIAPNITTIPRFIAYNHLTSGVYVIVQIKFLLQTLIFSQKIIIVMRFPHTNAQLTPQLFGKMSLNGHQRMARRHRKNASPKLHNQGHNIGVASVELGFCKGKYIKQMKSQCGSTILYILLKLISGN
jgi:hypothetical protein